jgi:hypothetical protein
MDNYSLYVETGARPAAFFCWDGMITLSSTAPIETETEKKKMVFLYLGVL